MDGNELDLQKNTLFMNNLSSTLSVKRDYHLNEYDYEWLLIIEDALPYIDNIVRNPKRFIINEEEIVKVELAKKITVDSVIHLTQHTNLIQDVNDKGEVKPSKILNINKDDSLDTYENRFAYTLIKNLEMFFNDRVAACGENSSYEDRKTIVYEGKTKVGTEDVTIHVDINSLDACINDEKSISNLPERLKRIKQQLDGFHGSELMKTLTKLHVPPVTSPIRKTNVILKNPNFQQAEKLWNYIQTFESKDQKEVDKKDYLDQSELRDQYNQMFMMIYTANEMLNGDKSNKDSYSKVITDMIDRFIENNSKIENLHHPLDIDKIMQRYMDESIGTKPVILEPVTRCVSALDTKICILAELIEEGTVFDHFVYMLCCRGGLSWYSNKHTPKIMYDTANKIIAFANVLLLNCIDS